MWSYNYYFPTSRFYVFPILYLGVMDILPHYIVTNLYKDMLYTEYVLTKIKKMQTATLNAWTFLSFNVNIGEYWGSNSIFFY